MKDSDEAQLQKIESDIEAIKTVLRNNSPLFRTLVAPDHFRLFSLILGIMFLVIPGIYYYFMRHYGGYANIPHTIRTALLFVVAFAWIIAAVLKQVLWMISLDKNQGPMSWRTRIRAFLSPRIIHIYLPVLCVAVFLIIYLLETGNAYYVIPCSLVGMSVIYNFLGTLSRVWQYLVSGYWFVFSGIILLFNPITPPIALMVSFGIGFLLFTLVSIGKSAGDFGFGE